jgi:hypothetical protein
MDPRANESGSRPASDLLEHHAALLGRLFGRDRTSMKGIPQCLPQYKTSGATISTSLIELLYKKDGLSIVEEQL